VSTALDPGTEPAPPAAVLWDMDGTLVDSEKLWDIALAEAADRLGGTLSARTRERMLGANTSVTMTLLFEEVGIVLTEQAYAETDRWLSTRMAELLAADLPWQPGALEALRGVRASGTPTALVTSTVRGLAELALDTIGREFFDVTICGDEVDGLNKPHPEPYLRAARALGVDSRECVAVEDSPTGVAAAVAAGCTTIVVPSELPVEPGEGRILRESLVGIDPLAPAEAHRV
jgi:HAD superfamily hydrolase (TIGR01509 family)